MNKIMKFVLRRYKDGDQKSLVKNINHKEIFDNTSAIPHPYTLENANNWIKRCRKLYKQKEPKSVNFAIDYRGNVIGSIGFHKIDRKHKRAEIGYWLGKEYWGFGIMTKAVRQTINYGFKKLKLKRIYAYVFAHNKASTRVLEKCGFKLEGCLKKHFLKNGKYVDAFVYGKIRR